MDLSGVGTSTLVTCRAWSHTDRRHMLTLISQAPDTPEGRATLDATVADAKDGSFAARIATIPEDWDAGPRGELRFLSTSWSARAPRRLKIESILFGSLSQARNWAECGVEEVPGRLVFTLEAFTDGMPKISPY